MEENKHDFNNVFFQQASRLAKIGSWEIDVVNDKLYLQQLNIVARDKFKLYMITSSTDASDKIKARSYPVIKKLYPKPLSKKDLKDILISNEML